MFYFFSLLLPFVFNLSFILAVLWVFMFLIKTKFDPLTSFLILLLLLRCFMFLDTQNLTLNNQFLVCRETFEYRSYDLIFLCDSNNTYLSYLKPDFRLNYLDEIYIKDLNFISNKEKHSYYKSLNVAGEIKFSNFVLLNSKTSFLGKIYDFKKEFKDFVFLNLNDPFANLFLGILMGDRSGFSEFLNHDLRFVGLTHLVAVSGMNVILILKIVKSVTWIFGRRISFLINASFVLFFAYFTSLTTSVLRACFMALINLWADYNFEKFDSIKVLFFTAYALLLINPYYIVYDLSYGLSFLATFALISIKKTEEIVNNWKLEVQANLVSFWFTLPILLFAFKSLPILTVFSNLLVLIPSTIILYLGLLLIVLFLFNFSFLNSPIFFLLDLFGSYFFWVVDFTKKFPLMTVLIESFTLRVFVFLALILIFFVFLRKKFIF